MVKMRWKASIGLLLLQAIWASAQANSSETVEAVSVEAVPSEAEGTISVQGGYDYWTPPKTTRPPHCPPPATVTETMISYVNGGYHPQPSNCANCPKSCTPTSASTTTKVYTVCSTKTETKKTQLPASTVTKPASTITEKTTNTETKTTQLPASTVTITTTKPASTITEKTTTTKTTQLPPKTETFKITVTERSTTITTQPGTTTTATVRT